MIAALLSVLGPAFTLLNTEESRKYSVEILKLEQEYHDEINKPRNIPPPKGRDNSELDRIEHRLHLLSKYFVNLSREKNT